MSLANFETKLSRVLAAESSSRDARRGMAVAATSKMGDQETVLVLADTLEEAAEDQWHYELADLLRRVAAGPIDDNVRRDVIRLSEVAITRSHVQITPSCTSLIAKKGDDVILINIGFHNGKMEFLTNSILTGDNDEAGIQFVSSLPDVIADFPERETDTIVAACLAMCWHYTRHAHGAGHGAASLAVRHAIGGTLYKFLGACQSWDGGQIDGFARDLAEVAGGLNQADKRVVVDFFVDQLLCRAVLLGRGQGEDHPVVTALYNAAFHAYDWAGCKHRNIEADLASIEQASDAALEQAIVTFDSFYNYDPDPPIGMH